MKVRTLEVPLRAIDREIRKALNDVVRRHDRRKLSRSEWTRQVKQALSRLGRNRNFAVAAHGCSGTTDPEWLLDLTWAEEWGKGAFLRQIVLAAECEWNRSDPEIDWDFQKLLAVRARLRLFVFDQKNRDEVERVMKRLGDQIRGFRDSRSGDRYLLAGSSSDSDVFQVVALVVEGAGEPGRSSADGFGRSTIFPPNLRVFSEDEAKALFNTLGAGTTAETDPARQAILSRDEVTFLIMYRFGLRTTEVVALNLDSFEPDPDKPELGEFGVIRVPTKEGQRKVKALWPESSKAVAEYVAKISPGLSNAGGNDRALFLDTCGKRMTPNGIRTRFRYALAAAGIRDPAVTLSVLKHTFVENACALVPVEDICEMIGETSFVSFRRDV
jgi:integrase